MCRLFGMSAAPERVRATFWLLDAPDSLARQSHREPDGTGLGIFTADGRPDLRKQPLAAYEDEQFTREAKDCESTTFVAHIRYASTGGVDPVNTHPFEQQGRLFAHNGVIGDLSTLDQELGEHRDLVRGDTDSERFFALITAHIGAQGDVGAGIAAAAQWVAGHLPVYALNAVLTTPAELWALRYPDTHDLFVLRRAPGGQHGDRHLDHAGTRLRAHSGALVEHAAVVVASERMDEDPGWQDLAPGELLHVGPDLAVTRRTVLDRPPRHRLTLAELGAHAAASQAPR
ncbi:class II glutamine amidotransferase [Amycolatopsis pithecellobii]|uniref:Class II glutamine amidotransferase n=1 Tax=Amycolatopsis pithecellobii TaxID=664692 RepID=A0A6N7Z198_9PSEU|nr:class II glutamine amidotransferase [Amycolatopsis pithecellobii]MTD55163.1 class II glutamine amidotransferase [Amycolatopsis pithecellobii]